MALRVSSATPVLGTAIGVLGIGAASAAAGQAFRKVRLGFERGAPSPLAWPPWQGVQRQDLMIDALSGLLVWRVGLHVSGNCTARCAWACTLPSLLGWWGEGRHRERMVVIVHRWCRASPIGGAPLCRTPGGRHAQRPVPAWRYGLTLIVQI